MKYFRAILLPVASVSVTFLVLWGINRPVPVAQSSMEQVQHEAERGGYRLIDGESLWKLYETDRDNILLVDVRQEWEHRAGHIVGSLHFSLEPTWWARWQKKRALEHLLGPDKDKILVFY